MMSYHMLETPGILIIRDPVVHAVSFVDSAQT